MKKKLAGLLVAAMVLSMGTSVFAAKSPGAGTTLEEQAQQLRDTVSSVDSSEDGVSVKCDVVDTDNISDANKEATGYSEDAEEQVDAFYSKLIKLQQSAQIEQRHDAGWIEEINQILDVLKSGDVDRITAMIEAFGNDDNSAWFDQMEKDLPWLTGMLLSLRDESGNILITPETVQAAYNAATEGIAIANKEAENFRKTV